jgi:hypothetical protein
MSVWCQTSLDGKLLCSVAFSLDFSLFFQTELFLFLLEIGERGHLFDGIGGDSFRMCVLASSPGVLGISRRSRFGGYAGCGWALAFTA